MEELRHFKRHLVPLEVEYSHDSTGTLRARARDMSDGGLFVMVDESFQLEVGSEIIVRSLGLGPDGEERGPDIAMKVVRRNRQGMGLEIVKGQESQESIAQEADSEDLTVAPRTLLQRLLILDDCERVLLWRKGDHWHLPCRELQATESWKAGIKACFADLEREGALAGNCRLEIARQCIPATSDDGTCIEFLVPCRYSESRSGIDNDHAGSIRWVEVGRLEDIGCPLEQEVIDSLGIRV
ncbi:MAG: PilZ domain-containing protein [Proteobacteria bacterium]|nr:PilZ domain-containing protein [Pseudomonadota bacterium]MDA0928325.1 PilZ domain-containing protein [Pseudomonadota bacterium]